MANAKTGRHEQANRETPPHSQEDEAIRHVQELIRSFLRHYRFLHEFRIQKLLFNTELMALENHGEPIVNIPFKKYFHGAYSELVNLALSQMEDVRTAPDEAPDGRPTVVFLPSPDLQAPNLPKHELDILKESHEWTRSLTNEDLAIIGKTTSAWKEAKFGEVLDLKKMCEDPAFRATDSEAQAILEAKKKTRRGEYEEFDTIDDLLSDLNLQ